MVHFILLSFPQENCNEILSIQRSLWDYTGMLLQPSRIFLKKGMLQKFSRKTLTPRMFFLVRERGRDGGREGGREGGNKLTLHWLLA